MPSKEEKSLTVKELATLTGSKLFGNGELVIRGVSDLDGAGESDASFFANPKYEKAMRASSAGVTFLKDESLVEEGRTFLVADDPSLAFQKTLEFFMEAVPQHTGFKGVHASAVIADDASIGEGVTVAPNAVVESGAIIGAGTVIGPNVTVGQQVKIGADCVLHPSVVIQPCCELGDRVVLHPGVVIGSDGFGYTPNAMGAHIKLQQIGNVVIEDDVEIGSNTTIDRARFKTTRVRSGTKIDNLVQLGHGVELGENNLVIAQVGIAGSTKTGRSVVIAGQSAIIGHAEICDGVVIAAKSGVIKSIKKPGIYGGMPAGPVDEQRKLYVHLRNLDKHVTTLKELKKRMGKLESNSTSE